MVARRSGCHVNTLAFYAPTEAELRASFKEIGSQLANVRLER
jgi:hypothetical protein